MDRNLDRGTKRTSKMTANLEPGSCRFVVTKTDVGNPVIKRKLFHDTVLGLRALLVGFEVLGVLLTEWWLATSRLELSRFAADAFACC
jgi:hypothetical protein